LPDWVDEPYIISRSALNTAFPNDLFPGLARSVLGRALRPAQVIYWHLSRHGSIGTARWLSDRARHAIGYRKRST
jgi:hypothetical protein